jgi:hypothetical protein
MDEAGLILFTRKDFNLVKIEEYPESKFLKKGWASRDEQRWNRKSYRKLWKKLVKILSAE